MMAPNDDITNNSHTCNKNMDNSIITTITKSAICDDKKLLRHKPNKYSTPATTTTCFSNVCGGSDKGGSSTSSSVITPTIINYLFVRHDYEKLIK